MCYFVCSDIAHFGNKGKQKKSISRRKTGKVYVFYVEKSASVIGLPLF